MHFQFLLSCHFNFTFSKLLVKQKNECIIVCLPGLPHGTTIVVTPLTDAEITATYGSDASNNFVSYIEDPANTKDKVQRLLVNR